MRSVRSLDGETDRVAVHVVALLREIRDGNGALRIERVVRKRRPLYHVGKQIHRLTGARGWRGDRPAEAIRRRARAHDGAEKLGLLGDHGGGASLRALERRAREQRRYATLRRRLTR